MCVRPCLLTLLLRFLVCIPYCRASSHRRQSRHSCARRRVDRGDEVRGAVVSRAHHSAPAFDAQAGRAIVFCDWSNCIDMRFFVYSRVFEVLCSYDRTNAVKCQNIFETAHRLSEMATLFIFLGTCDLVPVSFRKFRHSIS